MTRISRKAALALATTALLAPVGVQSFTASAQAICPPGGDPDIPNCPVVTDRDKAINRATTWLTAGPNGGPVPYSQSTKKNGYRTDCSGYASMALQIPSSYGGPNTEALATTTYTTKLSGISQLRKGDLIIDPRTSDGDFRHVVIFQKWKDASNKSLGYWAYEQRGTYGTTHRVLKYGIGADHYDLYSPKKLNY